MPLMAALACYLQPMFPPASQGEPGGSLGMGAVDRAAGVEEGVDQLSVAGGHKR